MPPWQQLRAAVLSALGGALVHELQNPLNAACLQADVLAMPLHNPQRPLQREQLAQQIDELRERLTRLARLQRQLGDYWLTIPDADAGLSGRALREVVATVGGVLRPYCSHRGIALHVGIDGQCDDLIGAGTAEALQFGLAALLLMEAGSRPQRIDVHVQDCEDGIAALIELPAPASAGALGALLGAQAGQLRLQIADSLAAHGISLHEAERLQLRIVPGTGGGS